MAPRKQHVEEKMNSIRLLPGVLAVAFVLLLTISQMDQAAAAAEAEVVPVSAAAADAGQPQDESYQRVYETFAKLIQNVSNNSLGNARRLVSRLNQLVGGTNPPSAPAVANQKQQQQAIRPPTNEQSVDEKTDQLLTRLDNVNKNTDQNTLRQLNEDVNRFVGTLSESYLRNIRRLIERVNKVVGTSSSSSGEPSGVQGVGGPMVVLHQDDSMIRDPNNRPQPGFPGWDELIVAVDRVQKSLANFVRSSTKLITSG